MKLSPFQYIMIRNIVVTLLPVSPSKSIHFIVFISILYTILIPTAQTEWMESENLPVCTAETDQHFPVLTTDGENGVIVAWRDARNGNYDIFAQRITNSGEIAWTPDGIAVCNHAASQSAPMIVHDLSGGVIIVWGDTRNGSQDSYAQRIDNNGNLMWNPDGVSVCTEPALQDDFTSIADENGGVIVIWEDWRNGNQDIYAQKINADGNPVWIQNGVPVYSGAGDQYDPDIISDGDGGAFVVWWDISTPDWNIFAQRIDKNGNTTWDPPIPVCTAQGNQGAPTLVPDGIGGVFCVWTDYRNDPNLYTTAQLYAQHLSKDGETLWQEDGILICNLDSNQQQPNCISDGAGGFIVVWRDERHIFADLYAQRINNEGQILWDKAGIPVCTEGGVQQIPQIVSDGTNGAIIYWLDYREDFGNTTNDAIYAQRIDNKGTPLWDKNGVVVCAAEKEQITPQGISVDDGGAIIVWSDSRGKDNDIYIHRVK